MGLGRRDFLKRVAAAQAGLALGASATAGQTPQDLAVTRAAGDIIVVGAGAFGGWTAVGCSNPSRLVA
jgi:hypothetical protein